MHIKLRVNIRTNQDSDPRHAHARSCHRIVRAMLCAFVEYLHVFAINKSAVLFTLIDLPDQEYVFAFLKNGIRFRVADA